MRIGVVHGAAMRHERKCGLSGECFCGSEGRRALYLSASHKVEEWEVKIRHSRGA
jgi:hypothetical protein